MSSFTRNASIALLLASALVASAQENARVPVSHIIDDAKAIDRVAEVSHRDLPVEILRRIADQDLDLLRGKRSDGTYQYATWERMDAGRINETFSVNPRKEDELSSISLAGQYLYRVTLSVPSRRLLVAKNRRLYVDHVEIEYLPEKGASTKVQTAKVDGWIDPGESKVIAFDEIARQATVRAYVRADPGSGYSNVEMILTKARITDLPESPYADAVSSTKSMQRSIDHNEVASIRSMAQRIVSDLTPMQEAPAVRTVDVLANPVTPAASAGASPELYRDLQRIEDLLTGSDSERRQGLDQLHQLVRKMRQQSQ